MGIGARRLHRERHYGELAELRLTLTIIATLHGYGLRTRAAVLDAAQRNLLHHHGCNPTEIVAIRHALGLSKSGSAA